MVFDTREAAAAPDAVAPDGSEVRVLASGERGSMARFSLAPGAVARAVAHHSVEEYWYVLAGQGRMWRRSPARELIVALRPGVSLCIPPGAHFQFRCDGPTPLDVLGVTVPPWPGEAEAYEVDGVWAPRLLP